MNPKGSVFKEIEEKGMFLVGCGKMGSAMLSGWLKQGIPASAVHVKDPAPSEWLRKQGVRLNEGMPRDPAVALIAVKPQTMQTALPQVSALGGGRTLVVSIAAGTSLAALEKVFGKETPVIRAMPNTPAAVGQGITALVGNGAVHDRHMAMAEQLMQSIGQVVRLPHESQIDAVTAVSGSGPAYVLHMIECMAKAGEAAGLSSELAMKLAKATVAGTGQLAMQSEEDPSQLRRNVTSPNGTTQAGLDVLMKDLRPLMDRTIHAARDRSQELSKL